MENQQSGNPPDLHRPSANDEVDIVVTDSDDDQVVEVQTGKNEFAHREEFQSTFHNARPAGLTQEPSAAADVKEEVKQPETVQQVPEAPVQAESAPVEKERDEEAENYVPGKINLDQNVDVHQPNLDAPSPQAAEGDALPPIFNPNRVSVAKEILKDDDGHDVDEDVAAKDRVQDQVEISDEDVPDEEQARENIKKQEEQRKERKKKRTVVQGLEEKVGQVDENQPLPEDPERNIVDLNKKKKRRKNKTFGAAAQQMEEADEDDKVEMREPPKIPLLDIASANNEAAAAPLEEVKGEVADLENPVAAAQEASYLAAQDNHNLNAPVQAVAGGLENIEDGEKKKRRGKKKKRRAEPNANQMPQLDNQMQMQFDEYGKPQRDSIMRDDDITLHQQAFTKESFRRMIRRTFDDYYPQEYNRENYDLDEYMDLVSKEQLETKYGVFLEMNEENMLNMRNMPWLDIGDLPLSYNNTKSEAFQVFMTPTDEYPSSMIVEFSEWSDVYDNKKVQRDFEKMSLLENGIMFKDIEDTLDKGSSLLKMYLGRVTMFERRKNYLLGVLFFIFLIVACGIGVGLSCEKKTINASNSNDPSADNSPLVLQQEGCVKDIWIWSALIIVLYVCICFAIYFFIRYKSSQALRHSQFLLAVLCRAENNRLYLKHGVELRPGFLGKWIEVNIIDKAEHPDIVSYFRSRFLRPSNEHRAINFQSQVMNNDELIKEQKQIEEQILKHQQARRQQLEANEAAEVAEALAESQIQLDAGKEPAPIGTVQAVVGEDVSQPPPEKKKGKKKKKRKADPNAGNAGAVHKPAPVIVTEEDSSLMANQTTAIKEPRAEGEGLTDSLPPIVQDDNLPPIVQDNLPPIEQDNLPPIVQDNLPPIEQDNLPSIVQDNLPPIVQDNNEGVADTNQDGGQEFQQVDLGGNNEPVNPEAVVDNPNGSN